MRRSRTPKPESRAARIPCLAWLVALVGSWLVPIAAAEPPEDRLRASADGYHVSLRVPEGGLFAGEEMQLEFRVEAGGPESSGGIATRDPVRFARLRCTIDMPSMATMPAFVEDAHSEGVAGDYGVHPTFPHGGVYRLRIQMRPPDEQPATVTPVPRRGFEVEFPLTVADVPDPSVPRSFSGTKRFTLSLATVPEKPKAGEPTELRLSVRRNVERPEFLENGAFRVIRESVPITEFDIAHERLLHLFVVRDDLGTFAHEHPVLGERDGTFVGTFTFPAGGLFMIFADVAPHGAGSQVLTTRLHVAGPPGNRFELEKAAKVDRGSHREQGAVRLDWELPSDPLPTRKTVRLVARLTDSSGAPIADLEPFLGARGHLMMISRDGFSFVHAHPEEIDLAPPPGEIAFLARLPEAGLYRGWAQFQRGGKVLTFDFVAQGSGSSR